MANANAPLGLSSSQSETVTRLALMMKGVAAVVLLLGAANLVLGVATLLSGSPSGLLAIIEGLVTCLLGLIMLSSSADVRFMAQSKFASIHLGNAFQDLTMYYKVQFFLALFLIAVAVIRLFLG